MLLRWWPSTQRTPSTNSRRLRGGTAMHEGMDRSPSNQSGDYPVKQSSKQASMDYGPSKQAKHLKSACLLDDHPGLGWQWNIE